MVARTIEESSQCTTVPARGEEFVMGAGRETGPSKLPREERRYSHSSELPREGRTQCAGNRPDETRIAGGQIRRFGHAGGEPVRNLFVTAANDQTPKGDHWQAKSARPEMSRFVTNLVTNAAPLSSGATDSFPDRQAGLDHSPFTPKLPQLFKEYPSVR